MARSGDDDGPQLLTPPAPAGPSGTEHTVVRKVTSDVDPLIGAMLGEYRVLGFLGSGGMGLVYRGEQPVIGRPVAIKVLKRPYAQDPAHARRFLEEARSVSAARHPGIVDIFSFGETPAGDPYLVMELLEGEALDALLVRRGALPVKEALELLIPITNALGAAHAAGVIHRDFKPANVFIVRLHDGTLFPKLVDFGLARRGDAGSWVRQTSVGGTPLYVAPEQARGEPVGPQTDLYSLGCTMYEMLVGRPPFSAGNLHALLDQHQKLLPDPLRAQAPLVPVELERLVLDLLEKDVALRPATAAEVRARLERLDDSAAVAQEPTRVARAIPAPRVPALPPAARATEVVPRRRQGWATPLAVVAALAAGGGLWALKPWATPSPRTAQAKPEPDRAPPPPLAPLATAPLETAVEHDAGSALAKSPSPPRPPHLASTPAIARQPQRPLKNEPAPPSDEAEADLDAPEVKAKPLFRNHPKLRHRWNELVRRSHALKANLSRTAETDLNQACSASPAECKSELADIDNKYWPK